MIFIFYVSCFLYMLSVIEVDALCKICMPMEFNPQILRWSTFRRRTFIRCRWVGVKKFLLCVKTVVRQYLMFDGNVVFDFQCKRWTQWNHYISWTHSAGFSDEKNDILLLEILKTNHYQIIKHSNHKLKLFNEVCIQKMIDFTNLQLTYSGNLTKA